MPTRTSTRHSIVGKLRVRDNPIQIEFLRHMLSMSLLNDLSFPLTAEFAIQRVVVRLTFTFGSSFTYLECWNMLRLLRQRYVDFLVFLQLPGVRYNVHRNIVVVSRTYWDALHGRMNQFHNNVNIDLVSLCGVIYLHYLAI